MPTVECIRIDTNASWGEKMVEGLDLSKTILMCTYHPGQTTEENFLRRIDEKLELGLKIGMVNFVLNDDNFEKFDRAKETMAERGIPLHPNPLWDSKGRYSEDVIQLFERELPELDYNYRTGSLSPRGKRCLFPSIAWEMDQVGRVKVGCHSHISGDFFAKELPETPAGPVPCPLGGCSCLDKYSFLKGSTRNTSHNPLQEYANALMKITKGQNGEG